MYSIVVSPEMYAHMTHHLSALSNGKIILILEGGYNLHAISLSMTLCTKALLGDPLPPLAPYKHPIASAMESIRKVIHRHSTYWSFIKGFNCRYPFNKSISVKWETDRPCEQNQDDLESLCGTSNLIDLAIEEKMPMLPNTNTKLTIEDDFVKDSEYIPLQFGGSISIAGTNTLSDQNNLEITKNSDIVIDSQDYVNSKTTHATSEALEIPTTILTNQLRDMNITRSEPQALSLPEFPSRSEYQSANPLPNNATYHLQNEYIPFQYGSHAESNSVYTFTKSNVSRTSLTDSTITTDSKSGNIQSNKK